jgi:hypothetical protein
MSINISRWQAGRIGRRNAGFGKEVSPLPEAATSYDIAQRKNARLSCVEFRIRPKPSFSLWAFRFERRFHGTDKYQ